MLLRMNWVSRALAPPEIPNRFRRRSPLPAGLNGSRGRGLARLPRPEDQMDIRSRQLLAQNSCIPPVEHTTLYSDEDSKVNFGRDLSADFAGERGIDFLLRVRAFSPQPPQHLAFSIQHLAFFGNVEDMLRLC
jgi:hypothetical protein